MIDSFTNNLNHPFRLALKDNDVYDWKPESQGQIVFCRMDEEVDPRNAVVLYNSFKAKGVTSYDTVCASETLPHFQCAQFAVLSMKAFVTPLQSLDSCAAVSVNDIKKLQFSIYPNPATDVVKVGFEQDFFIEKITAINNLGQQIVLPFSLTAHQAIADVKNLQPGVYFLRAVADGKEQTVGRFIKAN